MRCVVCLLITTLGCAAATPLAAPPPRHYTHEEWQAIKAKLVISPRPDYPSRLRALKLTGSGLFRLHFDSHGVITAIDVLKSTGHRELDDQATETLIRWRAKPGVKWDLDEPVSFIMR
jgi:TonB family protein